MKGLKLFQTIQVRFIIIYVLLILIAMQLIGVYFVRTMERSFIDNFSSTLKSQATLLAGFVDIDKYLSEGQDSSSTEEGKKSLADLNGIVNSLFDISGAEIQIIDANGIVLSTSLQSNSARVGQKNIQAEVLSALQGIKDNESELIDESGERKKIVAQPVGNGSKVNGVVYIVASMEPLYRTMNGINKIFLTGTIFALVLTAALGIILSNAITNPIKEITRQATAMAEGNYNQVVRVKGSDEIGQLGHAFNYMTDRLKDALALNEEEKEKLSSILSNMNDGVIATDDRGKVLVINRRARQMLRMDKAEIRNQEIWEMLGLRRETMPVPADGQQQMALVHIGDPEEDETVTLRVTFTPILRRDKSTEVGTIAVLQDVTEQEKLEQARREFVANVSHELRTPLTTIKSYLEALDDGAVDDRALAHRFVGVMRNETERMIRLVNDLLHLSRLDSRKALMAKVRTQVPDMLEEVADRFAFQLQQKNIQISISADAELADVKLDRDQIDQVLDNLVSNAIKYTPEGGYIQLFGHKLDDHWMEFRVQDNGIGIPKKDLDRIFDRFYRVDKARSRSMGGTGLGLSIAREIVKAHGGMISLESEYNHGTRVTFTLPLQRWEGDAV